MEDSEMVRPVDPSRWVGGPQFVEQVLALVLREAHVSASSRCVPRGVVHIALDKSCSASTHMRPVSVLSVPSWLLCLSGLLSLLE